MERWEQEDAVHRPNHANQAASISKWPTACRMLADGSSNLKGEIRVAADWGKIGAIAGIVAVAVAVVAILVAHDDATRLQYNSPTTLPPVATPAYPTDTTPTLTSIPYSPLPSSLPDTSEDPHPEWKLLFTDSNFITPRGYNLDLDNDVSYPQGDSDVGLDLLSGANDLHPTPATRLIHPENGAPVDDCQSDRFSFQGHITMWNQWPAPGDTYCVITGDNPHVAVLQFIRVDRASDSGNVQGIWQLKLYNHLGV